MGAEHYLIEAISWVEGGISYITVIALAGIAERENGRGFRFFGTAQERDAWYEEVGDEVEERVLQ